MGRRSQGQSLCHRILNAQNTKNRFSDNISKNSGSNNTHNGNRYHSSYFLTDSHSDCRSNRFWKQTCIGSMIQTKYKTHRKNTGCTGKYTRNNCCQNCRKMLFQKLQLLIQRNCQTDRGRSQEIADDTGAAVVGFIINSKNGQKSNHKDHRNKKRI